MERDVGGICGIGSWDIEGGRIECRIERRFVVEEALKEPFKVPSQVLVGYGMLIPDKRARGLCS